MIVSAESLRETSAFRQGSSQDRGNLFSSTSVRYLNFPILRPGTPSGCDLPGTLPGHIARCAGNVGENGAGKSTLIKLLCKLYKPSSGRIACNGIDILSIDTKIWWQHISAIFQDFGHYNLTVMENVTFTDNIDSFIEEKFLESCRQAKFTLDEVYHANSFLGKEYEGTELSGGQWQRLALARTLFADGSLVILDEPTSAMDPRVESQLFMQFYELVKGKTSVMVTHRLGAVKNSSRIIVLKNGKLIEDGTPEELERIKGEYYSLLTLQRNQFE